MPKKKDQRTNIRWTDKNKLYLRKLGLIDQHGYSKAVKGKAVETVNDFVNKCVTIVCESSMNPRTGIATADDLRNAYSMMRYRDLGKQIQSLMDERREAKSTMTEEFALLNT